MEIKEKIKATENGRKISAKNYIILAIIFAVATIITLYCCNVYNVYQESKLEIPVIRGTLSEITREELEHYISENPSTILYICTARNKACRNYEKDLKKLVKREELQDKIIYLNLAEEEVESFTELFNKEYTKRIKITANIPALIAIEEGKLHHLLQPKGKENLTITKTKQFIDIHEIGE